MYYKTSTCFVWISVYYNSSSAGNMCSDIFKEKVSPAGHWLLIRSSWTVKLKAVCAVMTAVNSPSC